MGELKSGTSALIHLQTSADGSWFAIVAACLSQAEQQMEEAWEVDTLTVQKIGKLGKGQSGDVHLAVDASGRQMALKTVPITLQANDVLSLLGQLKELYSSRHPNVTAFYGAAYDDKASQVKIAYEYMDLKSLKDILQRYLPIPSPTYTGLHPNISLLQWFLDCLFPLPATERHLHLSDEHAYSSSKKFA